MPIHHHHHRAKPAGFLFTTQSLRMASMLVMLVVIGMTIERTRPWERHGAPPERVAARQSHTPAPGGIERAATPSEESASSPADPEKDNNVPPAETMAAGPDDRDPEEAEEFRRQVEAVKGLDLATAIDHTEMPAYWRVLKWVSAQTTAQLAARAPIPAVFQELIQRPNKFRGKLVTVELTVRQAFRQEDLSPHAPAGFDKLYELRGWPTANDGWIYYIITPELPPGFPEGAEIQQTVRVYGYFFRVLGYHPGKAKPDARPVPAPLIIGRVEWIPKAVPTANPGEATLSYIVLAVGGAILLSVIGYWFIEARRKKNTPKRVDVDWPMPAAHESLEEPAEDESPHDKPRDNFDWLRE
jgi:hypothetical protein